MLSTTAPERPVRRANRQPSTALRLLLADNLIRLRKARGLTQHQLAHACGLPQGYIGDVERAAVNITLASLEALAIGLECFPVDLFGTTKVPATRDEE